MCLCGQLLAARALSPCSGFCGAGQVVLAAAAALMAGLAVHRGDDFGREGKQAGPATALGRADTAAGRRRGGKPPERPPAAGLPSQADAAAVGQVPEGGAGFRCGLARRRRQLRGRTGRPSDMSGPVTARGGVARAQAGAETASAGRFVWW